MNVAKSIVILTVCSATFALAGCVPTAPEYVPDSSQPAATASASATPAAVSGDFDYEMVRDALASLPAQDGLEWNGGVATTDANAEPALEIDNVSTPAECLVFYSANFLYLTGDSESELTDAIFDSTLIDLNGAGYDDDVIHAGVTTRILDDPQLAIDTLLDPMTAAAPSCGAYTVDYLPLGWVISDVTSQEVAPLDDFLPGATHVQSGLVMDVAYQDQPVGWTIALVDNVLIYATYYALEGGPYADPREGANAIATDVITALQAQQAG